MASFTNMLKNFVMQHRIVVKFLFAGGTATSIQLAALFLFTDVLGLWYVLSAVLAFIIAVIVSFSSHKLWTFRDFHWGALNKQFVFYLAVQIFNLVANVTLIYLMVDILGWWYLFSQAIISLGLAVMSFFLYKHRIFTHSEYRLSNESLK